MGSSDRKAREFERRGAEIKAAALTLFKGDHWESVTVDQIAAAADVGKGTIYKHFASKDAIYAELAIDFRLGMLGQLTRIDPALPVEARFRQFMNLAFETHLSSRELHRVFLYCSRDEFRSRIPAELVARMQAVDQQASLPGQELILEGVASGLFPDKPVKLLMFGVQAAFWGAIQLIWSGQLGDIEKLRYQDELTDFILAGLRGRREADGQTSAGQT